MLLQGVIVIYFKEMTFPQFANLWTNHDDGDNNIDAADNIDDNIADDTATNDTDQE